MCTGANTCENKWKHRKHKKIVVEAKCIFPSDEMPEFPNYEVPIYHIPQLLCKLVAYKANELWLISFTLYSVTLIVVYFDEVLWSNVAKFGRRETWPGEHTST